jgi:hypothetical protein
MGEGLNSGRLDLIGRYLHGGHAGEPPKAPPWTSESAPAPSESQAERLEDAGVERDPSEVTGHAMTILAQSTDSLHRFHDTYDRVAGAAILAERAERRRAATDVGRQHPDEDEDEDEEELQHLMLVRRYTR